MAGQEFSEITIKLLALNEDLLKKSQLINGCEDEKEKDERCQEYNLKLLKDELDEMQQDKIFEDFRLVIRKQKVLQYLHAVFLVSPGLELQGEKRRAELMHRTIMALQMEKIESKAAREVVKMMIMEADDLSPNSVPRLVERLLLPLSTPEVANKRANGCLLSLEDFLGKLLAVVTSATALEPSGLLHEDVAGMSGIHYKEHVINKLCRSQWPSNWTIGMCKILKDLKLPAKLLEVAVNKITRCLPETLIEDMPSLGYQALLLSHGNGQHQSSVLGALLNHFDFLDRRVQETASQRIGEELQEVPGHETPAARASIPNPATLRSVEGTLLIHFNMAAKQGHELGKHLIKDTARIPPAMIAQKLTPFRTALLLSLARISRFEHQTLQTVVDCMRDYFIFWLERAGADWIQEGDKIWGANVADISNKNQVGDCLEGMLGHIVDGSSEWDHILQSLVGVGRLMLEENAATTSPFGGAPPIPNSPQSNGASTKPTIVAKREVAKLGRSMLTQAFQNHHVQKDVLHAVLNSIIARDSNMPECLHLLQSLCEKYTAEIPEDLLKEALAYLPLLPMSAAQAFLRATQPKLHASPSLQAAMVIPLRKALFSREERQRLVGLLGLMSLLTSGRNANVIPHYLSSQPSLSSSLSPDSDQGVLGPVEGFGLLRRCLGQQRVVRQALYRELVTAYSNCQSLRPHVVSLLRGHFSKYYASNPERASPLHLQSCVERSTGQILEPLPSILMAMTRIYLLGENASAINQQNDMKEGEDCSKGVCWPDLKEVLEDLVHRLGEADLEDFEIDKSSTFSQVSELGRVNAGRARLLCGVYEAAISTAVLLDLEDPDSSQRVCPKGIKHDTIRKVMKLFQCHQKLLQSYQATAGAGDKPGPVGKGKSKSKKGSKKDPGTHLPISPGDLAYLGLPVILSLLISINNPKNEEMMNDGEDALPLLLEDFDFQRLILETCLGHLQSLWTGSSHHDEWVEIGGPKPTPNPIADPKVTRKSAETVAKSLTEKRLRGLAPALIKDFLRQQGLNLTSVGIRQAAGSKEKDKAVGKGKGKAGGSSPAALSPAELSIQAICLCVKITAHCHHNLDVRQKATSKLLKLTFKAIPQEVLQSQSQGDKESLNKYSTNFVSLLGDISREGLHKECMTVVDILSQLLPLLDGEQLQTQLKQIDTLMKRTDLQRSPALARSITRLALKAALMSEKGGTKYLTETSNMIQMFLGPAEDDSQDPWTQQRIKKIVSQSTVGPISEEVVAVVECSVEEMEYVFRLVKKPGTSKALTESHAAVEDSLESDPTIDQQFTSIFEEQENYLCKRMLTILKVIDILVQSNLKGQKSSEKLFSCMIKIFRLQTNMMKFRISLKLTWLSKGLKDLLNFSVGYMKHMTEFLRSVQNETGSTSQHKMAKQGRLVPEMIYQMEQRDRFLLKVGRLCKGVDVSRWVKRTTARDFKIDAQKVLDLQEKEKERQERKRNLEAKRGNGASKKQKKGKDVTTQMEEESDEGTAEENEESSDEEEEGEK